MEINNELRQVGFRYEYLTLGWLIQFRRSGDKYVFSVKPFKTVRVISTQSKTLIRAYPECVSYLRSGELTNSSDAVIVRVFGNRDMTLKTL